MKKEKTNYKKFSDEKIESEIKNLNFQLTLAKAGGQKSAELEGKFDRGQLGSDIQKRLRKQIARLKTEQSERRLRK